MKFPSKKTLADYGPLGSAAVAAAIAVWSACSYISTLRSDATALKVQTSDQEIRLRVVEEMRSDVAAVKRDVAWIRHELVGRPADASDDTTGDGWVYEEGPWVAGDPAPTTETR